MRVFVLNQRGKALMPTNSAKARILLKKGKAKVVKRTPFTIQLLYSTGETKQPIVLGVDSGYQHIGLSAIIETKELFSAETFMSTVRRRLVGRLKTIYSDVEETWGYVTKMIRGKLGLIKSHRNDAFIIAGGTNQTRSKIDYFVKQVRKQNRKLFKGIRSHIRNKTDRIIFGSQRWDKVKYNNQECFIYGRRSSGYFDVRLLNGTKIHSSVKHSKLKLLERFGTFLWDPIPPSALAEGLLGEEG